MLEKRLSSLVRSVGENFKVNTNLGKSARTDGQTVTVLDPEHVTSILGVKNPASAELVSLFLALHEASHVKYSDFDVAKPFLIEKSKEGYNPQKLFAIMNAIEDCRVERLLKLSRPGTAYTASKAKALLFHNGANQYVAGAENAERVLTIEAMSIVDGEKALEPRFSPEDNKKLEQILPLIEQGHLQAKTVDVFPYAEQVYRILYGKVSPKSEKDKQKRKEEREKKLAEAIEQEEQLTRQVQDKQKEMYEFREEHRKEIADAGSETEKARDLASKVRKKANERDDLAEKREKTRSEITNIKRAEERAEKQQKEALDRIKQMVEEASKEVMGLAETPESLKNVRRNTSHTTKNLQEKEEALNRKYKRPHPDIDLEVSSRAEVHEKMVTYQGDMKDKMADMKLRNYGTHRFVSYSQLLAQLDREAQPIVLAIKERMRQARERDFTARSSGTIATRLLHKLPLDTGRIFNKNQIRSGGYAIHILVDISGSTTNHFADRTTFSNSPYKVVDIHAHSSYMLAKACTEAGIPCEVTAFTTTNGAIFPLHFTLKKYDSKDFSDIPTIRCYDYGYQHNRDGWSLRVVSRLLARRSEPNKILIMISDGVPACNGSSALGIDQYQGHRSIMDTKQAVNEIRATGIKVLGLYTGYYDDTVPHMLYGKDYVRATTVDSVAVQLANFIKRTIQ